MWLAGGSLYGSISTHAPLAGSDDDLFDDTDRPAYFNPRSPRGERPLNDVGRDGKIIISTHAPLAGSDWQAMLQTTV